MNHLEKVTCDKCHAVNDWKLTGSQVCLSVTSFKGFCKCGNLLDFTIRPKRGKMKGEQGELKF